MIIDHDACCIMISRIFLSTPTIKAQHVEQFLLNLVPFRQIFQIKASPKSRSKETEGIFSNHPPYQPLAGWHEQIVVGNPQRILNLHFATSQHFWVEEVYRSHRHVWPVFFSKAKHDTQKSARLQLSYESWRPVKTPTSAHNCRIFSPVKHNLMLNPQNWTIIGQKRPSISAKKWSAFKGWLHPPWQPLASNFFSPVTDPLTQLKRLFVGGHVGVNKHKNLDGRKNPCLKNMRSERGARLKGESVLFIYVWHLIFSSCG